MSLDADVIVIGAGAAGLAAARSLANRSLRVIVLEARDRLGGRVWSVPSGGDAVPVELGAEFIHGPAEATMALLREAGGTAIETGGESLTGDANGGLHAEDDDFISAAGILEGARALAGDMSVDRFLRRFDGDASLRATVELARAFVEGFEAADPAIASVRAIADELRSGVDATSARPLGGYRPMFEHLANACVAAGVRTYASTVVRRIKWRRGDVAVTARSSGDESWTVRARAAVVTLPVGVLRDGDDRTRVDFEPSLPTATRAALGSIEMGHVVKVALRFRTAFWERIHDGRYRDTAFFRTAVSPFPGFWTQFPVRSNLIVAWAGGPKATVMGGASPSQRIEHARDGFGTLLGECELAKQEFEGGATHDWNHDPFARGAYSYVAAGGGNARASLAAPIDDTIFFAGEATSSDGQGGTVNGALETGKRAAAEAARSLGVGEAIDA